MTFVFTGISVGWWVLRSGLAGYLTIEYKDSSWIDARTLHKELKVGKDFTNWIKGRISKYEFVENEDYKFSPKRAKTSKQGGRPSNNYSLTLDMAKELSMVENNKIGQSRSTKKEEIITIIFQRVIY